MAALTLDLRLNTLDQHKKVAPRGSSNHHWVRKLKTELQATWILCLSILPPDSGTLISKWNEQQTSSLSLGKTLLTLSMVQDWLDTRNATLVEAHVLDTSVRGGSRCTDSCLSPLVLKLQHIFVWPLLDHPLRAAVILFFVHLFLPHFLLPLNLLWICLDTAICEQHII
jgi:hypothetical protein